MSETKRFPTLDVVTVATGTMVSDRGIEAVYDVCDWMLNDSLMTHQLPNAARTLEPHIYEQHPWIEELELPKGDIPLLKSVIAQLVEWYGTDLMLTRPESPAWVRDNGISDLEQIVEGRPVIVVRPEGGTA